jgi:signal transduction histidine kinase
VNFEKICIKTLLEEVIEELDGLKKTAQKIELNINFKAQIVSDKQILRNILYNLISNAIKYSPEEGVIKVHLDKIGGDLKITVEDQGIGIDDKEKQNIFTRFFRANNAMNIKGTGLGLHLVKNYLEKINGSISFESEIGVGSQFFVFLPLNQN